MMWWDASTVRALRGNASVLTHRVRMTSGARMSTDRLLTCLASAYLRARSQLNSSQNTRRGQPI